MRRRSTAPLTADTFEALLDLVRRLPPTRVEANVDALVDLAPEYADDLLGNVDQPLRVIRDEASGRDFLGCDYNRDGDSFRSPWSDAYIPPSPGAPQPSPRLRQLEVSLNSAFDVYRDMYYEGGVSSVYLWDLEDTGTKDMEFAGVVLIKKSAWGLVSLTAALPKEAGSGSWDSLHVFECTERGRSAKYKLTSTIILVLEAATQSGIEGKEGGKGGVTLSGSMTRQTEVDQPLPSQGEHVKNIGKLVEDMEWVVVSTILTAESSSATSSRQCTLARPRTLSASCGPRRTWRRATARTCCAPSWRVRLEHGGRYCTLCRLHR